jgi:hypothetical protein
MSEPEQCSEEVPIALLRRKTSHAMVEGTLLTNHVR